MKNSTPTEINCNHIVGLIAARLELRQRGALRERIAGAGGVMNIVADPRLVADFTPIFEALRSDKTLREAGSAFRKWEGSGIGAIAWNEDAYPACLLAMPDPPFLLFYRGTLTEAFQNKPRIAVVGSRNATPPSCQFAYDLSAALARGGACVVSGLALGIDGAAHHGALAGQGGAFPTVAVLGNGLHTVYPPSHARLADQILESGGLLISQFEPDTRPYPSNFLDRNRVIAGLSAGTIVVQASTRSGALATARYAVDAGRDVFAVPGPPADRGYEGSNRLLKQGARVLTGVDDVYEELPGLRVNNAASQTDAPTGETFTPLQRQILTALEQLGTVHADTMPCVREEGFHQAILELELAGAVRRLPGNYLKAA